MNKRKNCLYDELKNEIEKGLITAHEYKNPELFLPYNRLFRFIKKIFLVILKPFTKYQIVFNDNLFYSASKTYLHLLRTEKELRELQEQIRKLKEDIKKTRTK